MIVHLHLTHRSQSTKHLLNKAKKVEFESINQFLFLQNVFELIPILSTEITRLLIVCNILMICKLDRKRSKNMSESSRVNKKISHINLFNDYI